MSRNVDKIALHTTMPCNNIILLEHSWMFVSLLQITLNSHIIVGHSNFLEPMLILLISNVG